MSQCVPPTSVTLLNALKENPGSARWAEFLRIYETPMRTFLARRFPTVEADDILQETLLALMKCLPDYHYTTDGKGHFHNYLIGIVKYKALDALRRNARTQRVLASLREAPDPVVSPNEENLWRDQVMEAALEQVLSDTTIDSRKREIFRQVVLNHEKPEDVARRYGTTRGNVDVIKRRMIVRLHEIAVAMMKVAERS